MKKAYILKFSASTGEYYFACEETSSLTGSLSTVQANLAHWFDTRYLAEEFLKNIGIPAGEIASIVPIWRPLK